MEHIEIALAEKGIREYGGLYNNNPEILKYAKESGLFSDGTDELPWCSAFMNWVAKKANLEMSKKSNARSWLEVGLEINEPEKGDIAIFWRGSRSGWQGHVGIFWEFTPSRKYINLLGGNQSNSVNIARYGVQRLLGFRRLRNLYPNDLRIGSMGAAVKSLQTNLNQTGYNCGKVDGHFGKQTEAALIMLQQNGNLQVTGSYNSATKLLLEGILKSQQSSFEVEKSTTQNKKKQIGTSGVTISKKDIKEKKTTWKSKRISTKRKRSATIEDFNFEDIFDEDVFEFEWDD